MHVIMQFLNKMLNGIKLLNIQKLRLKNTKEVFHNDIVQAITFSRHALLNMVCIEYALIRLHLIMPALVGMKDKRMLIGQPFHGLVKHIHDQRQARMRADCVTDDLTVV